MTFFCGVTIAEVWKKRASWLAVFILAFCVFNDAYASQLFVYYSSVMPAKDRENAIKGELSRSDLDVVVFAKFKEFYDQVKQSAPELVVAPDGFDTLVSEYAPVLQFKKESASEFKYSVFSMSAEAKGAGLVNQEIGIVEVSDRSRLKGIVKDLTSIEFKTVKSVSKPEDLFPLLVFKSVQLIVLSPDDYLKLKEKYSTKVYKIMETKSVHYPMVFAKKGADAKKGLSSIKALSADALKGFGFNGVSEIGEVKP
jgi:hypothetical protein